MSVENHPNIHAVGFTVDIIESFVENIRGKAAENRTAALHIIAQRVPKFVAELSSELDKEFGE